MSDIGAIADIKWANWCIVQDCLVHLDKDFRNRANERSARLAFGGAQLMIPNDKDSDTTSSQTSFLITARLKSFSHACDGLLFVFRTQHNAWIHIAVTICVFLAGIALDLSLDDWCKLIIATTFVWAGEAMNTAFEHLCDVVSPQPNLSVKRAKDIAAGAVLVCAVGAAILGILTFAPYVISGLT